MGEVEAARIEALSSAAKFYAESEEPWKALYREATACHQLERYIIYGIHLFEALSKAEEALRLAGVLPGDESLANELDRAWGWWLAPCKEVDQAIRDFEGRGYTVDESAAFRECSRKASRRPKIGTGPGSWRHAVKTGGNLFGRPILTKEDMRKKTGPFPDE